MMRKQWIYLQYPRFLFADLCFCRAKKTYLCSETVRAVLEEDMKKYLPKSLRDKKINNYSLNYLLANDKVFRNVFYFRLEQCKKTQSMISIVNDFNILTLDDYLSKMHCIVGSGN